MRAVQQAFYFGDRQLAGSFGRIAEIQAVRGEALAGRYDAAGRDDDLILDHGAIEYHGGHADQAAMADTRRVQHGLVAHRDVVADDERQAARLRRRVMHHVQNTAVLNIGTCPDLDPIDIAARHRERPEGGVIAQGDTADDQRTVVDVHPRPQHRTEPPIVAQGHRGFSAW